MSNHNEITGDKLQSKLGNKKAYDEGYDRIFGKKKLLPCQDHAIEPCACKQEVPGCCEASPEEYKE